METRKGITGKYRMALWAFGLLLALQPSGARAQELQDFLALAESNSPELKAFELKYLRAGEKVAESGALPNMELGAGWFASEPETRTGAQKARFSLRQMLPWFGSITARENYASSLAEVEYLDWVIARRKLLLQVSEAYYELRALEEQTAVLRKQLELLEQYTEIVLAGVEGGKASAVDALRMEIRKNEVAGTLQVWEGKYEAAHFAFFRMLNVAPFPIAFPDWALPDAAGEMTPEAVGVHPELQKYERLYASVMEAERLNQKSAQPGLGIGLDYIPVARRTDIALPDNGKDVFMPMVTLSIPVFNSQYRSRTQQNRLQQEQVRAEEASRRNALEALLQQALQQRDAERIRCVTFDKNIEQARQALEILLAGYQSATLDYTQLLEVQELELKLLMGRSASLAAYFSKAALVNYLSETDENP
jgi:outer membrane protein TolC